MPTLTNCPSGAKRKFSLPVLLGLVGLALLSFLVYAPPSKSALLDHVTSRLRDEKFEQLYEEAAGSVHQSVSREKFVRRMKAVASKLKAIDAGLNFKPNQVMEQLDGMFPEDKAILISSFQTLEGNGKTASVHLHWNPEGEFYDLGVVYYDGTPAEFNVYSVTQQSVTAYDQKAED
jgi:hypothetical protein